MHCSGAMSLDASLGATHDGSCLGHIEFFPVTQQKCFPLTCRQTRNFTVNHDQYLVPRDGVCGTFCGRCLILKGQGLQEVEIAVLARCFELRKVSNDPSADFLTPEPVHRCVGQNSLEKKGQLSRWSIDVFFSEPDHRVLNDVQCGIFIPDGVRHALECTSLDAFQEIGEFFV